MLRVGIGYDAHRLVEGRKLVLGGVEIPYSKGLLGHSDADVLLHSICDAILGALSLGDIGELFPDTDERFKGISSLLLLKEVNSTLKSRGYKVLNVDSVVVAQKPKLKPYREQMVKNISSVLDILPSQVSVKFTTTESMGFEGKEEGISAQAVVLIGEVEKW
ncbi:2-C-methyl-D-erythritol 2,4-cyclodiphosphate synthase [Thermovibrio guaymasensis]|uniref:2-C-methyl-D-erythritol 2,4-cyclodiphosphate synthase n=1 Tax=Thermovibrio guaymasensis TaxID=240167 RepID=A0A420W8F3_9BACT|nr:2-C-methyl-D-erythritol 2,4-cyclodiphosphate synthase [Thermovibrio guaymasensis]RKQ63586.1 2-C-methyl-D-erythritol 2,4-cyclodiphosphate synthase [Thermovibrio guaymasensis]